MSARRPERSEARTHRVRMAPRRREDVPLDVTASRLVALGAASCPTHPQLADTTRARRRQAAPLRSAARSRSKHRLARHEECRPCGARLGGKLFVVSVARVLTAFQDARMSSASGASMRSCFGGLRARTSGLLTVLYREDHGGNVLLRRILLQDKDVEKRDENDCDRNREKYS